MDRLLVCIDGSNYAESCCKFAAWIASRVDCLIEVAYVTDLRQFEVPFVADLSGSLGIQPFQAVMGQLQELEEKKAEVILSQAEKTLRESGYEREVTKSHKTGFLVDCLTELEKESDLIVLGKRGENANFATEHLGSTMERVVRSSSKPCFIASREFEPVSKVLIAYEDVESCREALDFIANSRLLNRLELHLITVAQNEEESDTLEALKKAEEILVEAGLQPICQMLHGVTSQAISKYAQENGIDLLVMGAYGHSRIRHLIIGSTTTEMLRDCRLPTLMFR